MICLTYFEFHNTFRDNTMNDYSKIKSESEKGEISENIKKGLNSDLLMFFFASYFYYLAMFYSSFKRNYFKEYLPFLGGDYNGIAFIILLKYYLKLTIPVHFLVFFPFINNVINQFIMIILNGIYLILKIIIRS